MNEVSKLLSISALSLALLGSTLSAQDHHDDRHHDEHYDLDRHDDQRGGDRHDNDHGHEDHYVHHSDWRRGHRMDHDDWGRGQRIDYREHHLRAPRRGYEWRRVDGNYVLAAATTGLIASIIASAGR